MMSPRKRARIAAEGTCTRCGRVMQLGPWRSDTTLCPRCVFRGLDDRELLKGSARKIRIRRPVSLPPPKPVPAAACEPPPSVRMILRLRPGSSIEDIRCFHERNLKNDAADLSQTKEIDATKKPSAKVTGSVFDLLLTNGKEERSPKSVKRVMPTGSPSPSPAVSVDIATAISIVHNDSNTRSDIETPRVLPWVRSKNSPNRLPPLSEARAQAPTPAPLRHKVPASAIAQTSTPHPLQAPQQASPLTPPHRQGQPRRTPPATSQAQHQDHVSNRPSLMVVAPLRPARRARPSSPPAPTAPAVAVAPMPQQASRQVRTASCPNLTVSPHLVPAPGVHIANYHAPIGLSAVGVPPPAPVSAPVRLLHGGQTMGVRMGPYRAPSGISHHAAHIVPEPYRANAQVMSSAPPPIAPPVQHHSMHSFTPAPAAGPHWATQVPSLSPGTSFDGSPGVQGLAQDEDLPTMSHQLNRHSTREQQMAYMRHLQAVQLARLASHSRLHTPQPPPLPVNHSASVAAHAHQPRRVPRRIPRRILRRAPRADSSIRPEIVDLTGPEPVIISVSNKIPQAQMVAPRSASDHQVVFAAPALPQRTSTSASAPPPPPQPLPRQAEPVQIAPPPPRQQNAVVSVQLPNCFAAFASVDIVQKPQ